MTQPVSELVPYVYVGGVQYPVESVSVTLDQQWAPYAQAEVTFPYDATLAAALDPRNAPRVQVQVSRQWFASLSIADLSAQWTGLTIANLSTLWTGLTIADLSDQWSTPWDSGLRAPDTVSANLGVRGRRVDYARDTITVRAMSDEMLAQDFVAGGVSLPQEPLPNRLLRMLRLAGITPVAYDFTAGAAYIAVPAEVTSWSESVWDAMGRMSNHLALRVWCDLDRTWRLTDTTVAPVTTVTVNRVTTADDTVNRDGKYANAIVWNGTGVRSDGTAIAESVQWPVPFPANAKVEVVTQDYGAVGVALPLPTSTELQARVDALASQARTLTMVGPADPSIRPGYALNTGTPSLPSTASVVAAVEFQVPSDTMTITTRATV
jgi:hypothetical protein